MAKRTLIIGSGINSLCCGVVLARAGHQVTIFEKNDWLGGNILTKELTVPGFKHEIFSGFHPLFLSGPFYKEFKKILEEYGLKYLNTENTIAVLLPDGRSLVLHDDREKNVASLEAASPGDGIAYRAAMKNFEKHADLVFGVLNQELWSLSGAGLAAKSLWDLGATGLLTFLGEALPNARKWLDNNFDSDLVKAVITPWVLHVGLGPEDAASSLMLKVVLASFEQVGMPVPAGGGSELVKVLVKIIEDHGGECRTNATVESIITERGSATGVVVNGETVSGDTVIANVTPTALYHRLLPSAELPEPVKQDTARYRYGRGNMQIHLSLDQPPNWPTDELLHSGMVHLTPGLNGVSRAVNEATRGLLPAEATIVVGQHTAIDPNRAPAGKWTLWLQLQELPSYPIGDALDEITCNGEWTDTIAQAYADRIIDRMDKQLPGLKESILERNVISPADLSRINPNLVGGDPYSGTASLDQFLFWRPLPEVRGHETPVKHLYHIGASTHPGPGLSGTSGYLVGKELG